MRKSARQFDSSSHQTFNAPPHADVAPRMPLIRLKPHKARVVVEDGAEMILVLKVTLNRGESVELASGGRMETMNGMLRIRERGGLLARADGRVLGKLTYVPETSSGGSRAPPEFQIDVPLGPREFRVLLDLGRSGRIPHKVFMQAGERTVAGPRGLVYRSKNGRTQKFWDNLTHRRIPVSNLTFVVPVDAANVASPPPRRSHRDADYDDNNAFDDDDDNREGAEPKSFASSAQVAELADELIVFQGETRHLLTAILAVVGLTALIVVLVSVLRFLR